MATRAAAVVPEGGREGEGSCWPSYPIHSSIHHRHRADVQEGEAVVKRTVGRGYKWARHAGPQGCHAGPPQGQRDGGGGGGSLARGRREEWGGQGRAGQGSERAHPHPPPPTTTTTTARTRNEQDPVDRGPHSRFGVTPSPPPPKLQADPIQR